MPFLPIEKLEKLLENEVGETIRWRDLPENVWYKIDCISDRKENEYGDSFILGLVNREGESSNVWSISNLIDKLKTKLGSDFDDFDKYDIYVISLGLKNSKNKRKYFNFKVVFNEKETSVNSDSEESDN